MNPNTFTSFLGRPSLQPQQPLPQPARTVEVLPTVAQAPQPREFKISEVSQAHVRCDELTRVHPSWTQAKVRGTVAREMEISTVQLRYLLRQTPK